MGGSQFNVSYIFEEPHLLQRALAPSDAASSLLVNLGNRSNYSVGVLL